MNMKHNLWLGLHLSNALMLIGLAQLYCHEMVDERGILLSCIVLALFYSEGYFLHQKATKSAPLFAPVAFLLTMSWLILWRLNHIWALKQLVWIVSGLAILSLAVIISQKAPKEKVLKAQYFWLLATFLLLVAPLVIGFEKGGAKSWIDLGVVTVQPSELAKVTFLLFLVSFYKNTKQPKYTQVIFLLFSVLLLLSLLVYQVDLGTALIFYSLFIIEMYLATGRRIWAIIGLTFLAIAGILAFQHFGHVRTRVYNWLDPWRDPLGGTYQLVQSLGALAAGGWWGTGLGSGKPYLIPAAQTDCIFAVIGEQMGFIGCLAVMSALVWFFLLAARLIVAIETRGSFLLSSGLTLYFIAQSMLIIGGVTKFIPLTGVTLPFVSYGGSSMLTCLGALGLIIGLCNQQGTAITLQVKKISRVKWTVLAGFLLLSINLLYWQIIKGADTLVKMLEVV